MAVVTAETVKCGSQQAFHPVANLLNSLVKGIFHLHTQANAQSAIFMPRLLYVSFCQRSRQSFIDLLRIKVDAHDGAVIVDQNRRGNGFDIELFRNGAVKGL
jgi:hypothetical protein